jgi:hypothetical protein
MPLSRRTLWIAAALGLAAIVILGVVYGGGSGATSPGY